MKKNRCIVRAVLFAAAAIAISCLSPSPSLADALTDLYGAQYDKAQVLSAGEDPAVIETQDLLSSDDDEATDQDDNSGIALYAASPRARSISPRSIPSEMLYFCSWESGQDYDHGLSWGDGYHALGYFQFDNRYDLGSFLQAAYYYNPSKYSCLAIIGSRYSWDVSGATRSGSSFTQLGNDLNSVWHACYKADPTEFSQLQNDWAYTQYYDGVTGIRGSLQAFGINIDNRSDSVKSLVWGMANLFGQGGGRSYVQSGLYYGANWFIKNSGVNGAMDDEQFVTTLCDYVINNVARRYPGQPEYWNGWQNRYRDEKAHYLSVMKKWVYENGLWYWQTISDGTRSKGWAYINGTWYYLDPTTGAMQTGWVKIGDSWYWMDASGAMRTGWLLLSGTWYWFDASGAMATGWKSFSGTWYWFDTSSGAMAASRTPTGNLWSDFTNSGIWTGYASGWDLRDGSWYWLENGTRATNWRYIGGRWYWFDPSTSRAAQNTTARIGGYSYAFDSSCGMGANGWVLANGTWYWANPGGNLVSGWIRTGGAWYWLNPSSCAMQTGWAHVGSSRFHLSASGSMDSGWLYEGGNWYWLDSANGDMRTGWQCVSGTWYYMDSSTGVMKTGWTLIGDDWYFMNASGAMQSSCWIGNYYLSSSGVMATSQWVGPYYVNENGCWVPGAKK